MNSVFTRLFGACCWALVLMTAAAWAEDPPLTLHQAVQKALDAHPDLAGFAFELRVQEARTQAAGLRPLPTLSAEVENVLGSGQHRHFKDAETTFALSQVIELGDKRQRRRAATRAGGELISVQRQIAQLDVLAEVTRQFIHVASDQEQLALSQRAVELAGDTVAAVGRRVDAGRAPQAELRRARVALARAELEQEHAEHELRSSRRTLAALWGDARARFGPVAADLYRMPAPASFDRLAARLEANPDFLRFASEARLRDAELRLAESRGRADITLSGGVRHLEETGDQGLVFGFSMPLGTDRQAAPAIAEAHAARDLTDAHRAAAELRARTRLYSLYQELRHAITETELLRNTALVEMEAALDEIRDAYHNGRYGYLEWTQAQQELIDIRRSLIEAAARAHSLQADIERLTGEPLATPSGKERS